MTLIVTTARTSGSALDSAPPRLGATRAVAGYITRCAGIQVDQIDDSGSSDDFPNAGERVQLKNATMRHHTDNFRFADRQPRTQPAAISDSLVASTPMPAKDAPRMRLCGADAILEQRLLHPNECPPSTVYPLLVPHPVPADAAMEAAAAALVEMSDQ